MSTTTVGKPAAQTKEEAIAAQVGEMKYALMQRLGESALAFTPKIQERMLSLGVSPSDFPLLSAACLVGNIPASYLEHRHNVSTLSNLIQMIRQLGYRKGEDYDIVVRDAQQLKVDEEGRPVLKKSSNGQEYQVKEKLPTVTVQVTAARLLANAESSGRVSAVKFAPEFTCDIVRDRELARQIFDEYQYDPRLWGDKVVVASCRVRKMYATGHFSPEETYYGFYVPYKLETRWENGESVATGKVIPDEVEIGKQKDNYRAPQIAMKRAKSTAARSITRTNFPRSDVPEHMREAALISEASSALTELEHDATEAGVTFDDYIANKDAIDAQVEEGTEILRQTIDPNTLAHSSKNSDGKKTETSYSPSAAANDASSHGVAMQPATSAPVVPVEVEGKVDMNDIPFDMAEAQAEVDPNTGEVLLRYEDAVSAVLGIAYSNAQHYKPLAEYITRITALNIEPGPCSDGTMKYFRDGLPVSCGYQPDSGEIIGDKFTHTTDMLIALLTGGVIDQKPSKAAMTAMFKDFIREAGGQVNKSFDPEKVSLLRVAHVALEEALGVK